MMLYIKRHNVSKSGIGTRILTLTVLVTTIDAQWVGWGM